jgi:Ribbon-helix-helix protein, copG family
MSKHALNTYLEPWQKARLERIAERRKVSQATIVREAIEEYVARHDGGAQEEPAPELWTRVLGGLYEGSGSANDHDDIYGEPDEDSTPSSADRRRAGGGRVR